MTSSKYSVATLVHVLVILLVRSTEAFTPSLISSLKPTLTVTPASSQRTVAKRSIVTCDAYVRQVPQDDPGQKGTLSSAQSNKKPLYPNVGDVVRFYDLDGGKADGQLLVGKISFIQKNMGGEGSGWTVEVTELEDLGDGYYGDYPQRQRNSKRKLRDMAEVSPVSATFVRTENAFKIPYDKSTGIPRVRAEQYDIDGYEGPFAGDNAVDESVVQQDAIMYARMKGRLLAASAIAGLAGTLVADLVKGPEDAIVYAAGVVGSLAYLFLLSLKTDTIASAGSKFGSKLASLRWLAPFFVLSGIAVYNMSLGEANPVRGKGLFDYITSEQYGAAVLGFLTYRVPLFGLQLMDALKDEEGELVLPGSAGVAMQLAKGDGEGASKVVDEDSLMTVLLVSGPQATGRSDLVKELVAGSEGKFVLPTRVDRIKDGANFDRLNQREEFLSIDPSGRYGLTKEGIVSSARDCGPDSALVVDADVALAKELTKIAGLRIVGVWVGLNSVDEFEKRLAAQFESGEIIIPEGESKESVTRARIKEIVQEIEYGISSGIFEFTILNSDEKESIRQLREAALYCFK